MYKIGDKVICKKGGGKFLKQSIPLKYYSLQEDQTYIVEWIANRFNYNTITIKNIHNDEMFRFNIDGQKEYSFDTYFYSKQEIRKLKLKHLDEV